MDHHFDIDNAGKYGIVEAVLINHFQYWLAKNAANHVNYFEGRYWTYNSVNAYSKLFPYLTADKIRRALEKLVDAGVLLKSNFNQKAMDRTSWYSLRDDMMPAIWQQSQTDLANSPNAFGNDAGAIPSNNTTGTIPFDEDNSSRTKSTSKNISSLPKNSKKSFEEKFDLSFVSIQFEETFKKWLRYKQERSEMYKTQMTLEENYRRLLTMANNDPWTAQQIVDYTISGGWMGYCMPKQKQQSYGSSSTNTTSRAQQLAAELKRQGFKFT